MFKATRDGIADLAQSPSSPPSAEGFESAAGGTLDATAQQSSRLRAPRALFAVSCGGAGLTVGGAREGLDYGPVDGDGSGDEEEVSQEGELRIRLVRAALSRETSSVSRMPRPIGRGPRTNCGRASTGPPTWRRRRLARLPPPGLRVVSGRRALRCSDIATRSRSGRCLSGAAGP